MPKRTWIVLGFGVLIMLGMMVSLKNRMSGGDKPAPDGIQILVAGSDIAAGSFVRSDVQLAMVGWPQENITDSMLTNQMVKPGDFNGAVARRAIQKGEPIIKHMLVKSSEGGFMSAVLEPGKRAVSIAVDSTTGNAGFIFPGDRVDLILTHAVTKQAIQSRASETFVENIRVLAVDQTTDNVENKAVLAKTVTLEVLPKQAEAINLAKDLGKISVSLRSLATQGEGEVKPSVPAQPAAPVAPQTLDDILREDAQMSAPLPEKAPENLTRDTEVSKIIAPAESSGQVVIIRGSQRSAVQFGSENVGAPYGQ